MTSRLTTNRPTADNSDDSDSSSANSCKGSDQSVFVKAPIDNLGVPGRWLRHKLLDGILVGSPVLTTIQKYRTPKRTSIMKMISFLGTEDFYTVLFLLISWGLDARLGRLFGILMGIGFYVAGVLKASLRLPRPEWPCIKPEEKAYDWALPSHHSLLGTILPWYIYAYVTLHVELSSTQLAVMFTLITLWSFSLMFSRLYLGVHSPADIVSGGFVGVLVLSMWLQVDDIVDSFISEQSIEPVLQATVLMILLLYLHPKCDPGNPSFTDNCCLAGVVSGLIAARCQRSRLLGFLSLRETMPHDTAFLTFVYLTVLRLVIGAVAIFVLRTILKFCTLKATKVIYRMFGFQYYSSSAYKDAGLTMFKHYTDDFNLTPVYMKKSSVKDDSDDCSSSDGSYTAPLIESRHFYSHPRAKNLDDITYTTNCWDLVVPTKCVIYFVLTYFGLEIVPQFFLYLGI